MKAVIQVVTQASVSVEGATIASIKAGICILLGLSHEDTAEDADYIIGKILSLRLFSHDSKGWQRSVVDEEKEILLLSQFTLMAVTKKGSKPDFHQAMQTEKARTEFARITEKLRQAYKPEKIQTGQFQAYSNVSINNDGPLTIILDSKNK